MHGLLVLRADALAGCTEASEQEAELTSRAFSKPMKRSGGLSPIPTPTAEAGWSASEREWQQYGKDTNDISLLEAFKEKHKADPVYVRLAETRIAELKKQQVAIAAPPAPPTQQSNISHATTSRARITRAVAHRDPSKRVGAKEQFCAHLRPAARGGPI